MSSAEAERADMRPQRWPVVELLDLIILLLYVRRSPDGISHFLLDWGRGRPMHHMEFLKLFTDKNSS